MRAGLPIGSLAVLGGWLLLALVGDRLVDPAVVMVDLGRVWCPAGAQHWLGCDDLGRDVLGRLILAASTSFWVALPAAALTLLLGSALGVLAGVCGGWLRATVDHLCAVSLAFPRLILAMALGVLLSPGLPAIIAAFALAVWPSVALPTRDQVAALRPREFVAAAVALGGTRPHILFRHLVPHLWPVWLARSGGLAAQAILMEAALSFLGLGAPDERPSWGGMIRDGLPSLHHAPAAALAAGVAVFATALAANLLSDRLAAQYRYG